MREEAILFGEMKSLVGIITDPMGDIPKAVKNSDKLPAIIILNGGRVHRVGLNRLHVKIARQLAAMGFTVLRFDFSGMGDSKVRRDNLPFSKSAVIETREAMDYLYATKGIKHFALMGNCTGAVRSFKTACCDSRVVSIVMINARGYLQTSNPELENYFRNRTLLRHYWRILFYSSFSAKNMFKVIAGKVDYGSILKVMFLFPLRGLLRFKDKQSLVTNGAKSDLQLLIDRDVQLFLIHSEADEGLDYLHVVLGDKLQTLIKSNNLKLEVIKDANHIFTMLWSQDDLLKIIHNWAQEIIITGKYKPEFAGDALVNDP